jgi:non-specific serine/threonine protein kinase
MDAVAGKRLSVAAPGKLPRHLTSFVGREGDLRALKTLVRASRLVTLTGTGGAGKSRLAAEVARDNGDAWPDGSWWVELAAETDVGGAVVANLELPGRGSPPQVAAAWLARRRALLVLDNCEHLVDQCAKFCQVLLELCPEVAVLATSREPLGVAGEVRWPVASLAEPDAVNLFEARARLVEPAFKLAAQNRAPVSAICERVDRLPLAIEMAAARLDLMSEKELLANLNNQLRVLATSARTAPERQQTMTATIDWSYRLLTDEERRLFRRLGVFQGGFTMEGAQAICATSESPAALLSLLSGLVKKSMVVAERTSGDSTRYSLLESHRDFAGERLQESEELDLMRRRHHDYFASRLWDPIESANFWHAVDWGRDHAEDRGLRLALAIGDADFSAQARARELILDLLQTGAQTTESLRAEAMIMAARLAWRQGDHAASKGLANSAVASARKAGDPELIARALNGAGLIHETGGELAAAGRMYDEALLLLEASTNRRLVADGRNARGLLAIAQGDTEGALEILTRCVTEARLDDDPVPLARYLESLANAQLDHGDVDQAAQSWSESLAVFRVVNDWFGIIWCLVGLALVAAARREDDRTLRLAAAADRLSREYSLAMWPLRATQLEKASNEARERLGYKDRSEAASKEGQRMTNAEVLDYALGGSTHVDEGLAGGGLLSRREREVAAMVASGMTNRQIAQQLFIAERTAEGHVERIRNKLGFRSRIEVATWAVAHGLGPLPLDNARPGSKV